MKCIDFVIGFDARLLQRLIDFYFILSLDCSKICCKIIFSMFFSSDWAVKICCKIVVCFCHWIVARFVAQILYVFLAHWIDAKFLLCFVIGLLKDCCMFFCHWIAQKHVARLCCFSCMFSLGGFKGWLCCSTNQLFKVQLLRLWIVWSSRVKLQTP
jgi:hypothetical protein